MINEGLDWPELKSAGLPTKYQQDDEPTDLDTVSLWVEWSTVVELQDDERESIRLSHLLVVIKRWTLVVKGEC